MTISNPFSGNGGAVISAYSFAWSKAQEHLWSFFAFAAGWVCVYGGLGLAMLVSSRPLAGFVARACAAIATLVFALWFSSLCLAIAQGRQSGVRLMVRSFKFLLSPAVLLYAFVSFSLIALLALPGICVLSLAASLPFLTPGFAAALAFVSWMYVLAIVALHANVGFALVDPSHVPQTPQSVSWETARTVVQSAWRMLALARAAVDRNKTQYAVLFLCGAAAFVLGIIPSIVTLGVGFAFLIFFFGIALARMYVGAHRINVPVSRE